MRDYPNMSYCQMSNTQLALEQVLATLRAALEQGPEGVRELFEDMDYSESRAYNQLVQLCAEFADVADDIAVEREGEEYEYDGQPDEAQEWADFDPDC